MVVRKLLLALAALFCSATLACATVAVDATGTANVASASGVTSANFSNLTIGGSANALIVTLVSDGDATTAITSPSATWDNGGTNQTMTLLGHQTGDGVGGHLTDSVWIFGLRAPTTGNKTLHISWTNTSQVFIDAVSFTGVNQTSDAAAFSNFNSTGNNAASSLSVNITSAVGNIVVGGHLLDGTTINTVSGTQVYIDNSGVNVDGAMNNDTGAATVTLTQTGTSGGGRISAGISINAGGGGGPILRLKSLLGVGQ